MPIYAYRCAECGHSLEVIQKVSDALLTQCPSCGKPALVKQVTAAGFQLKGAGWYVTDFRDSGKKKEPAKADRAEDGAKAGEPSGTKPETPAEKTSDKADAKSSTTTDAKADTKSDSGKSTAAPAPSTPKPGASSGGAAGDKG